LQHPPKIILGIDPGTVIMGFGLISVSGNSMKLVEMGCEKFSASHDAYGRLEQIHGKVTEIIERFKPACFAIEAPFFGKNVQSMLKLGRAQGVAIAAAMQAGLPVCEYSPKKIKQSITGNGNADKEQVLKMLQQLLNFTDSPRHFDASDALAVAVCHHFQDKSFLQPSSVALKDWKDFVSKNPGRII
jgi:crossover junction endodeoxyribonuclease RuvC